MKCTVLVENTSLNEHYRCEHGLSLFIETAGQRILFDTGQSDLFAENAEKLGVDLSQVDFAVISHGHYDHGGGIQKFLDINHSAPVYIHEDAFLSAFHDEKYIGLDNSLKNHPRIHLINEETALSDHVRLIPCQLLHAAVPAESYGLTIMSSKGRIPDSFNHEMALLIQENKRVCFSGCSHKGVNNYMNWFHPDVLIGGFHLKKVDPETEKETIKLLAHELTSYPAVYYTGHCTGEKQTELMKEIMKEKLHSFSAGSVIYI